MSRAYQLVHPSMPSIADYGWSPERGFFVRFHGEKLFEWIQRDHPEEPRPLWRCLILLAEAGYYREEDLLEVLVRRADGIRIRSVRLRRIDRVVSRLKEAAD